jgi:hypothetical protein
VKSYELAAEALVLAGGLLRTTPVTDSDKADSMTTGAIARRIPERWAAKVSRFLAAEEWQEFTVTEIRDYTETRDALMAELDPETEAMLVSEMLDHDLARAYAQQLRKARAYLAQNWPMSQMDTATGPKFYEPSTMEQGGAWALYAVLGYPERIVDELLMGALQDEQAQAFREVYPELFDRLNQTIGALHTEKQAASEGYELAWPRERVLRTLLGMPQDTPIVEAQRGGQPEPKPDVGAPIQIDFSSERPRSAEAA